MKFNNECTPDQAKAVWDTFENPNAKAVAKALRLAGYAIHDTTVRRWKAAGWKRVDEPWIAKSRMEAAQSDTNVAVSVLTMDPTTRLCDLVPAGVTRAPAQQSEVQIRAADLDQMSDLELIREANRSAAKTVVLINEQITIQRERLVGAMPDEFGSLIKAVASYITAMNEGVERFTKIQENLMKTIGGNTQKPDEDPLAEAFKAWRNPERPESVEAQG